MSNSTNNIFQKLLHFFSNRFGTVSSNYPFGNDIFDYPTPELYAAYGIPFPSGLYETASNPVQHTTLNQQLLKQQYLNTDTISITELPNTNPLFSD